MQVNKCFLFKKKIEQRIGYDHTSSDKGQPFAMVLLSDTNLDVSSAFIASKITNNIEER